MFDVNTKVTDYMSIVLTHKCTRHCPFCIDKYCGRNLTLSRADFVSALEFAKANRIKDIIFVGGEPTLHPNIMEFAEMVKNFGFRLIVTTNCDNLEIVYALDKFVDCFNFSHYGQVMPDVNKFSHADCTINKLLTRGDIDCKKRLDNFINEFGDKYHLKFSTLAHANKWTDTHQVDFLDKLRGKKIVAFGEVPMLIYRNYPISRFELTDYCSEITQKAFKCLVNGRISLSWEM